MAPLSRKSSVNPKTPVSRKNFVPAGDDEDDLWIRTREACRKSFQAALDKFQDGIDLGDGLEDLTSELAHDYENQLYEIHFPDLKEYRDRLRKDLTAVRNKNTGFAVELMIDELSIQDFCNLSIADLLSKRQKDENKKLKDLELRKTIGKSMPTSIKEVQDKTNLVSEKWGISESAAKVDDFEEP